VAAAAHPAAASHRVAAGIARVHRPAAIVSCHPLTGMAAVWARDQAAPLAPVVTVVTDLPPCTRPGCTPTRPDHRAPAVTGRKAWLAVTPAARRGSPHAAPGRWRAAGQPRVGRGPLSAAQQARLRRSLSWPKQPRHLADRRR
jgi:hypothetical protein